MDWNHDGKHDYKDEAFFHSEVMKSDEKQTSKNGSKNTSNRSSTSNVDSSGAGWFWGLLIAYIFIKLIGG